MDDPNMHAYGDHYPDTAADILRDVCELEPANPDLPDTVCVSVEDLKLIIDRHIEARAAIESALRDAPQQAATIAEARKADDVDRLLHQVFLLCEAVEDAPAIAPQNEHERGFDRGRRFEAKQIRRAIGDWFQWTFCGRSFMGEPVLAATPSAPAAVEPAQRWPVSQDPLTQLQVAAIISDRDTPTGEQSSVVEPRDERAEFEAWAGPITALAKENGKYVEVMTSLAWEAWQARASKGTP